MRRVIRNRAIMEDAWVHVADDEALPAGDVIVSLERWQAEREALAAHAGRVGVRIHGATDLTELAPAVHELPVVALEFPAFKDGRCLSHARVLRERYGYTGELRAVGDVLRDQLAFMERVGIDTFEIREDRSPEDALRAFREFSSFYQVNPRGRTPLEIRRERGNRLRAAAG